MLEPVSRESSWGMGMVGGGNYTDDRGEFRLRAGPGKYRVRASPREGFLYAGPESESSKRVYGPTYFPSTANRDHASVIEATAGGDVTSLQRALTPGGEITGMLEFAGGGVPSGKPTVRLKPDIQFGKLPSGEVDKDGAFHVAGVLPDRLRVQVDSLPENAYIKTME